MTGVTEGGDAPPETFQAFADRIGKSRPYVSKMVGLGVISADSLTADRKIIPHLALRDLEAGRDPARSKAAVARSLDGDATFAHQRARKTRADADRAELELQARRGELVERAAVSAVLSPAIREMRDAILAVPRDALDDPVAVAACEEQLNATLAAFSARLGAFGSETGNHGGAGTGG